MIAYNNYKPSGIDWIGDIPEHWQVKRIKSVAHIYRGASPRPIDDEKYFDENGRYSWVRISDVTASGMYLLKTEQKLSELGSSLSVKIKPGDLFLSIAGSVGKPIISMIEACIHDGFLWLKEPRINTKFLIFILYSDGIYGGLGKLGTQLNLNSQIVGNIIIPIPIKEEQISIANYLDEQTQKIDSLISNKKSQIEKLKELRQIEINNAVTKGLNPNAEMKDSGIEWLGQIPKHWKVKRIKNVSNFVKTGSTPSTQNDEYYENGEVPWFGPSSFNASIELKEASKVISSTAIEKGEAPLFPSNSILLVGIGATIGKSAIFRLSFSCNQQINVIYFKKIIYPDYAAYLMKIYESIIIKIANFATLPIFNQSSTANLSFLAPPIEEQIQISDYLHHKTNTIAKIIENLESQIQKLEALRKIRIYEAVTGKIKIHQELGEYAET